ncbi:MAG: hypothetical protein HZA46_04365 [Planctomycetales bacterium]|nr:hypothetical protein [Planctomycetales bacterium]
MSDQNHDQEIIPSLAEVDSTPRPQLPKNVVDWFRLWFGLRDDVGRVAFAISGFGLMLFKYAGEAFVIHQFTGRTMNALEFLAPVYSLRAALLAGAPEWLGPAMLVWTLPFLWISISMSIRRAANAGFSPWLGFLVMVPLANMLWMIGACVLPTSPWGHWELRKPRLGSALAEQRAGVNALLVGLLATFAMVILSVFVAGSYGATLFFASPLLVSAVTAFAYNRPVPRSLAQTFGLAQLSIVLVGAGLLLFALEGVICIAMAYPLAAVAGAFGCLVGKAIADFTPHQKQMQPLGALLCLPVLAMAEPHLQPLPVREIVTVVEIAAPPEIVWNNVVAFPDLPDGRDWYFRLGIACPERATIDGEGVGATRYCIFSTGTFVEPITVWDKPRRLAFDVTDQPHTMKELSPYRHVHAPHLNGTLRSRRGEFRLIELPGGRTRLEGRTWYEFGMYPQPYWTAWSDSIIHAIHLRVLDHIRALSEASAIDAHGGHL